MTADPERGGRPGIDVAHTPSSDGVEMGIEATIYFTLNTESGAIKASTTKFGTRQFLGADGERRYPGTASTAGTASSTRWCARSSTTTCGCRSTASAAPSWSPAAPWCKTGRAASPTRPGRPPTARQNNTNIAKVQQAINDSLRADLRDTLGGDFFQNLKFNLVRVTLPGSVQDAVNKAQAAFAQVSEAQAKVAQAQAEADANKKRQEGYNACTTCAQIDMIKSLPPGITTYAPGAGAAVPVR